MKIDRINVGSIDFASGVLRGVIGNGVIDSDRVIRLSKALIDNTEQSIEHMHAAARYIERLQRDQQRQEAALKPQAIPCRMCQAGPGDLCTYKGAPIMRALGGHAARTPKRLRRYHHKRVADARQMRKQS